MGHVLLRLGGQGLAFEPELFLPRSLVVPHLGVTGDVLEVEAQQAALARGAAVTHGFLVRRDAGGFEFDLHQGEVSAGSNLRLYGQLCVYILIAHENENRHRQVHRNT